MNSGARVFMTQAFSTSACRSLRTRTRPRRAPLHLLRSRARVRRIRTGGPRPFAICAKAGRPGPQFKPKHLRDLGPWFLPLLQTQECSTLTRADLSKAKKVGNPPYFKRKSNPFTASESHSRRCGVQWQQGLTIGAH